MAKKEKIILVDSSALIHRAFHALPPLTTARGEQVNAVYGFALILLSVLEKLKPRFVACAFDLRKPTFRHKIFPAYKAKRIKAPEELYEQIPRVKEMVRAFNIPILEKEGFEADDIIATLQKKIRKEMPNTEIYILTGDLDTLQLVDAKTRVYTQRKGLKDLIIYDPAKIKERYGLSPQQMIDYKALRGDPSDNIPGVKGIGEKTAISLLKNFGSLEKIYRQLSDIKGAVKEKLKKSKKQAFFSKKLAILVSDIPLKFSLKEAQLSDYDRQKVVRLFQELEFKSLLSRLPESETQVVRKEKQKALYDTLPPHYHLIDTEREWQNFLRQIKKQKAFVFDTETSYLGAGRAPLIGLSFSWKKGEAFFLPVNGKIAPAKIFSSLKPLFESKRVKKYGHNLKYDYLVLKKRGIITKPLMFDTMIASYLLNPGTRQHSLDALAFSEFGYEKIPISSLIGEKKGKEKKLEEVPLMLVAHYSCEDADITWRLFEKFSFALEKSGLKALFLELEMPLVRVLAEMEENGIKLDLPFLKKMAEEVGKRINKLAEKIYEEAGCRFNINSNKQLPEILFKKLKISPEGIKRTQTSYSTAQEELLKLKGRHPIISHLISYREVFKLKTTYLDALPELADPETQRVHTSFNQTVTATGRLSSSDPNLQNIPARTELGEKIRQAFIAEKRNKLISLDYSQIELRIAAHIAKDQKMIKAFKKGEDIHTATASEIFNVPINKVTERMRRHAKTLNFGVLYGMSAYGFSQAAGVTQAEAEKFIQEYQKEYQGISKYVRDIVDVAKNLGYVETLLGRKRYLPEINATSWQVRAAAERMAINMPIQGTAADMIKLAMIGIYDLIKDVPSFSDVKIVLQVHDELVFEVPEKKIANFAREAKKIMENVLPLTVPVIVEAKAGDNWSQMKPI